MVQYFCQLCQQEYVLRFSAKPGILEVTAGQVNIG